MITLRCDGCSCHSDIDVGTTCYYVVSTAVFEAINFQGMACPITGFPTEWIDVEAEEKDED